MQNKKKKLTFNNNLKYWSKYLRLNRDVVHICGQISLNSRFWSPCLSLVMPDFIILLSYLLQILVTTSLESEHTRYVDLFEMGVFVVFLYLLIDKCALVVDHNGAIQRQNRRFYLAAFVPAKMPRNSVYHQLLVSRCK